MGGRESESVGEGENCEVSDAWCEGMNIGVWMSKKSAAEFLFALRPQIRVSSECIIIITLIVKTEVYNNILGTGF